ncbi:MAG: hypothetical protein KDK66_07795, partial [Deltaproteobacteria bacterium]|nr:hypothetical protein [Deltaproteobacteria bacterium]
LPHLVKMLNKNPFESDSRAQGIKMAQALEKIAKLNSPSIQDPVKWQKQQRKDRILSGRSS